MQLDLLDKKKLTLGRPSRQPQVRDRSTDTSSPDEAAWMIFMAVLGFGLTIMFCTTFCRACSRLREEQIEREAWRRAEHDGRPPSIYVIPFPRSLSQDSDDMLPRHSQDIPAQYSNGAFCEAPPAYSELGIKPDDLPPAYTEYSVPMYPLHPVPAAVVQPHHPSQP